eukprot:CAMPEP_0185023028 /NCGR_PEP_ID=MMETSP1103-20130426/5728_1 /TAXON_ID=36769 /ORGANISM="Paraphysomonas bandaiensis, Strain Caron Lab Isolate" /LENGTH=328 /DNA_ID=CAMNT_0027555409 /DNA_START=180 /DNA_END=1166 /DNA_ORIENTATION=+
MGPLNPVPLAISFINLLGVVIYGSVLQDMFLVLSVSLGVVLNLMGCTTAISLLAAQGRDKEVQRMERLILTGVFMWIFIVLSVPTYFPSINTALTVMGVTTCSTTVLYYCSPLSSIRVIVSTKNASSLYMPMLIMNLISALLWFSYGFWGAKNIWIYIPNGVGLSVTLAQLYVKILYANASPMAPTTDIKKVESRGSNDEAGTGSLPATSQHGVDGSCSGTVEVMSMGLGGMGGIGGVGAPALVEMDVANYDDGEVPAPLSPTVADLGMGTVQGIVEVVPVAASAVMETLGDIGEIILSTVMDVDNVQPLSMKEEEVEDELEDYPYGS